MKIIDLKTYRVLKERKQSSDVYKESLLKMQKHELLQELLKYHESYQKNPHDMDTTLKGQALMAVLENRAELKELRELSKEFQTKLKARLERQLAHYKKINETV